MEPAVRLVVIGLGCARLPLAVALAAKFETIGFGRERRLDPAVDRWTL